MKRHPKRGTRGTPCPSCEHPVSMHVRRGCIGYVAATDARCACAAVARAAA